MADDGSGDTKLTRTKARWAEEGKFLTGRVSRPEAERLPPGQHLVKNWPVLDLGVTPSVSTHSWRLDVGGLVENPVSWNWPQFSAQQQSRKLSDIHCVTTWSRYDNTWEGLSALDLLDIVQPRPEATHILFGSYDGYTTNVALKDFATADAIIAHSWEGAPLTGEHGGPVRMVIPHLYFWKSAKWLTRITFVAADQPGFWEVRGYNNHGDPWLEERYS
jgi:DMSO/TMAO reductase YedYZ molybdopterin-dependent catalytic subunit